MNRREVSARLMATYMSELEEQVPVLDEALLRLEASPHDATPVKTLLRVAHALKGASRAVQMSVPERLCHALEALLQRVSTGALEVTEDDLAALFQTVDLLGDCASRLRSGAALDEERASTLVALLGERAGQPDTATPTAAKPGEPEDSTSGTDAGPAPAPERHLRVDVGRLEELGSATTRLELWLGSASDERARLQTLIERVKKLERASTRTHREARADRTNGREGKRGGGIREELRRLREELERLSGSRLQASRAALLAVRDVSQAALQLRMRPFSETCEGLPRAVRDLATNAGKSVQLELSGGDVEVDRGVLDGLRDAVLQLVRNAIDHGIEDPETRQRKAKPKTGRVRVMAELEGELLSVSVSDDGAGLDLAEIRAALHSRGSVVPEREDELARAIFDAGVSTRRSITQISGRGVGLDVVRHAAEQLQGSVDVTWEPERGTTFTIRCPPTLTMFRAMTASVGEHLVAVQTSFVERVVRLRKDDLRIAEGRRMLTGREGSEPIPAVRASRLLSPLQDSPRDPQPALVLEHGGRRLCLLVDDVLSEQEILLRPFDEQLVRPALLSGAALLGPQRVALVLSPGRVIEEGLRSGPEADSGSRPEPKREPANVLVVDDSLTTRTLEQSILAAEGYRVSVAADGAEAWRMLREQGADLVVADVEMPRMDGFELCEAIRSSSRFRDLPVVLVTALDSVEHRTRGMEVGANAYIVKAGFDQQSLLDTVRQLLG